MLKQMEIDRIAKILSLVPLFNSLNPSDLKDCAFLAQERLIKPSTLLFRQGNQATTLFVVIDGQFRASEITPDGREILHRFLGPGDMLGGMAAVGDMKYPISALAVAPSRVLTWTTAVVHRLMEKHPKMALNAMRLMVQRIQEFQQRCIELSTQRVEQRIARAIARLASQTGRRVADGVLLDVALSRQDLAEMTGTTLFTVSRQLNQWRVAGLVRLGRRRVTLLRPHELMRIAEDLPSTSGSPASDKLSGKHPYPN